MSDIRGAVAQGNSMVDQKWFTEMNNDAAGIFENELRRLATPPRFVLSTPVEDGKLTPGLVAACEGQLVVLWAKGILGRKRIQESYSFGSGGASLARGMIPGIPHESVIVTLNSRRVVFPSEPVARTVCGLVNGDN